MRVWSLRTWLTLFWHEHPLKTELCTFLYSVGLKRQIVDGRVAVKTFVHLSVALVGALESLRK